MATSHLPFGLSKNLAALIILGLAVVVFIILRATRPDAQISPTTESVFSVRTLQVEPRALSPTLSLYGTAVAVNRAKLTAAVSADVLAVHARAGSRVAGNELLLELDNAEAEIALIQARASLQNAQAQLGQDRAQRANHIKALEHERALLTLAERAVNRAVNLRQQGALSEADLDATKSRLAQQKMALEQRQLSVAQADSITQQLRATVRSAEARLQRAELDLQRTQIRAPFDAAIIASAVATGDRVNPGQFLFELYDTTKLEIKAQIPNRYIGAMQRALAQGIPLEATAQVHGRTIPARFARLAASGGGGGQSAYFSIDPSELAIDSNVSLELALPAEAHAVAVPSNAIYDLSRVFRVTDGRLQAITIEKLGDFRPPGESSSTGGARHLLIRSAELRAGDQIIANQLPNAMSGLKVQIIQP